MSVRKFSYSEGYILPTVLIFLVIMLVLVLEGFEITQLQKKMLSAFSESHQKFFSALQHLHQVEKNMTNSPSKLHIIMYESKNDWMRSKKEWAQKGNFFYQKQEEVGVVIEKIIDDPCVSIDSDPKKSGSFYRISIWVADKTLQNPVILQAIWLTPSETETFCISDSRFRRNLGEQSWEEVE
jgi:hypothetical protein